MFPSTRTSTLGTKVTTNAIFHKIISCIFLGSVVPSFLHRAHKRCTESNDKQHHASFLLRILENRNQDMKIIKRKFGIFMRKLRKPSVVKTRQHFKNIVKLRFDAPSKINLFTRSCILSSYKNVRKPAPRIIHSSLPKVMSYLVTKRSVLRKVKFYKNSTV